MGGKPLSDDEKRQIDAQYEAGKSVHRIARLLYRSDGAVRLYIDKKKQPEGRSRSRSRNYGNPDPNPKPNVATTNKTDTSDRLSSLEGRMVCLERELQNAKGTIEDFKLQIAKQRHNSTSIHPAPKKWTLSFLQTDALTPPASPLVTSAQRGYGVANTTTQQRPFPQVPQLDESRSETGSPPPPPMAAPRGASPPPPPPPLPPGSCTANGGASAPASQASSNPPRSLPSAQPNRGNLLAEIRAGKALKSVGATNTNAVKTSSNDVCENVIEQSKAGPHLKHVDMEAEQEKRKSTPGGQDLGGIDGALARVIAARRSCIVSDSDSDESEKNRGWTDSE